MSKFSFSQVLSVRTAVLVAGSCALMAHGESAGPRIQPDFVHELARPVLPAAASNSSFRVAFGEMEAADRRCDDAWRRLRTKDELLAYGRTMREKFIASLGGFPKERCPLNARTVATVQRDGYKVEKVLFETWPGVHVTANLFLPSDPKYRPPYPAVLLPCGHTGNGKGADMYQRGCVLAAKAGMACLIYDPYCQGERSQRTDVNRIESCSGHNRFGSLASLLGFSAARYRIWDGMRALDYLESRPEVDRTRLGCMGQSGGGTMTSLFTAIEPRLTATCPACYISTYRASAANIGPGDAEQNHFAQFPMGINNASLILMAAPRPVRLHVTHSDFFPFRGARETYGLIRETAEKFGWGERYSMTDVDGPHHWNESLRTSSVEWLRYWLCDDKAAFKHDLGGYRALDKAWTAKTSDIGLANGGELVAPKGWVRNLPGERRIFDVLRDELDVAEAARKGRPTVDEIRALAGIRETPLVRTELERKALGDVTAVRAAYRRTNGLELPAVAFVPKAAKGAPVLVVGNGPRQKRAERVRQALAAGRPVVAVDLTATGEIGACKHAFYDCPAPEEEVAIYLYTLGRSLVGEQAGEILALARELKAQFGAPAEVVAFERTGVAAVHARAVGPDLVSHVDLVNPPPSWTDGVRKELYVPFATVVNGALRRYDWTTL